MFEIDMKLATYESEIARIGNNMLNNDDTYKWLSNSITMKVSDWIKVLEGKNPNEIALSWGRLDGENSIWQNPDRESIIRGIVESIRSAKEGGDLLDFDFNNAPNSIPRLDYIGMESDRLYYRWSDQLYYRWRTTKCTQLIRSELCKMLNCCASTIHMFELIDQERDAFRMNSS